MLFILSLIFAVVSLIGLVMVNRVGNYENIWGGMLFYGGIALAVTWFLYFIYFLLMLVF